VHLELFASRQVVVVVPGGIGVSGDRTERYGRVVAALWHAPVWTTQAGGVLHAGRTGLRLSDFCAVWERELTSDRLLGFRDPVHVFVNGRVQRGAPGDVVLRDHDQIVMQVGGYVPPRTTFVFPPDRAAIDTSHDL
jgi:hypothetical protein